MNTIYVTFELLESPRQNSKASYIMIRDRNDVDHCLVEEVFGFKRGVGVAMRSSMKIRHATSYTFTLFPCNIDRLSRNEEICAQKNTF